MGALTTLLTQSGFAGLGWQIVVMFAVGGTLIFLAVRKGYEPLLLIPIGFGAILANLSNAMVAAMGPNVAGVIGSAVAAGVFLALLGLPRKNIVPTTP